MTTQDSTRTNAADALRADVPAGLPDDILALMVTPEFQRDPYPFLHRLRESDPVHLTSKGFYLATRHPDAELVLAETGALFQDPDPAQLIAAMPQIAEHRSLEVLVRCMMAQTPPKHTHTRRLVAQFFTPAAVSALTQRIGQACDGLLDAVDEPLRDGEVVDLHHTVAEPLPLILIAEMLAVPPADRDWLVAAVPVITAGLTAAAISAGGDILARADAETGRVEAYFRQLAAERQEKPGDDLISALACVSEQDPNRLTEDELVNLVWLLWLAANDTVAIELDHCVWSMTSYPDQSDWLRGGPDRALAFVNEVVRRTPPTMFSPLARPATREVRLGETVLPAGSDVRAVIAAANRDPEVFPDPDRFDPSRDTSAMVSFGASIHRCLGVFLAPAVLAQAVARLYDRFPQLTATTEPRWGGLICDPATRSVPVVAGGGR
jgi:cytochrome P450